MNDPAQAYNELLEFKEMLVKGLSDKVIPKLTPKFFLTPYNMLERLTVSRCPGRDIVVYGYWMRGYHRIIGLPGIDVEYRVHGFCRLLDSDDIAVVQELPTVLPAPEMSFAYYPLHEFAVETLLKLWSFFEDLQGHIYDIENPPF